MNGQAQKLKERLEAQSRTYTNMAIAAGHAEDEGNPQDPIDAETHYTLLSDAYALCASQLDHIRE